MIIRSVTYIGAAEGPTSPSCVLAEAVRWQLRPCRSRWRRQLRQSQHQVQVPLHLALSFLNHLQDPGSAQALAVKNVMQNNLHLQPSPAPSLQFVCSCQCQVKLSLSCHCQFSIDCQSSPGPGLQLFGSALRCPPAFRLGLWPVCSCNKARE